MGRLVLGVLCADAPQQDLTRGDTAVVRLDPHHATPWAGLATGATHAVVLGERRHELAVRHHAALAADLGLAVAWRAELLGPLALVAAARYTAQNAPGIGLAPAMLDAALAALWNAAWVPKVARLDHPAPSLAQHLRSWLPVPGGYLVTLTGEPRVERVTSARAAAAGRHGHLLHSEGSLPAAARDLAQDRSGAADLTAVAGFDRLAAARFGPGAVELVALPENVGPPAPGPHVACPACGVEVPAGFCPYCRVRRAETAHAGAEA